jgi:anti-sigma B factor antagonist
VKFSTRQVDGVTVLDASGRITMGEGANALRERLREALAANQKKILLNMAEVSFIDSSGIRELVAGSNTVAANGGQLKLMHLSGRVRDLMQITKLYDVLDVHDDEAAAVRSFK